MSKSFLSAKSLLAAAATAFALMLAPAAAPAGGFSFSYSTSRTSVLFSSYAPVFGPVCYAPAPPIVRYRVPAYYYRPRVITTVYHYEPAYYIPATYYYLPTYYHVPVARPVVYHPIANHHPVGHGWHRSAQPSHAPAYHGQSSVGKNNAYTRSSESFTQRDLLPPTRAEQRPDPRVPQSQRVQSQERPTRAEQIQRGQDAFVNESPMTANERWHQRAMDQRQSRTPSSSRTAYPSNSGARNTQGAYVPQGRGNNVGAGSPGGQVNPNAIGAPSRVGQGASASDLRNPANRSTSIGRGTSGGAQFNRAGSVNQSTTQFGVGGSNVQRSPNQVGGTPNQGNARRTGAGGQGF